MAFEITKQNGVATFTILRPQRKNAISTAVADGLERFLNEIENDGGVFYAVITGSDGTFCSGGDLAEYQSLVTSEDAYPMLSRMANLLYRLAILPVPTIALIDGIAVGGGCEIATACDYRLMANDASAGFIQGTLAITTGWGGATLLYEKMNKHDALLRFLSGAKLHTASQLQTFGWATEVYEGTAEDALRQFIAQMAKVYPSVHCAYKKVATRKWKQASLLERMLEEVALCARLWESDAHHAAVRKFLRKG